MSKDEFIDEYIKWIKEYPKRSYDGLKLSNGFREEYIRYDMKIKLQDIPNENLQELLERLKNPYGV